MVQALIEKVKKSNAVTQSLPPLRFFDSSLYVYYCVATFSFYVVGVLKLTDHFLAKNIAGYEFSGSYAIGMAITCIWLVGVVG